MLCDAPHKETTLKVIIFSFFSWRHIHTHTCTHIHVCTYMSHRTAIASYLGVGTAFALYTLDEVLDLRQWRVACHRVSAPNLKSPVALSLSARTRPPPIGAMDWPAGRVLLQLALEGDGTTALSPIPARGATVLEIGSGIGTAAIGLALALQAERAEEHGAAEASSASSAPTAIVATDICSDSLANLAANALSHGLRVAGEGEQPPDGSIGVARWDASAADAARSLPLVAPSRLTHVLGADVVYSGGAAGVGEECGGEFVATLRALLEAQPQLQADDAASARPSLRLPRA